jgi:hypothetical protein
MVTRDPDERARRHRRVAHGRDLESEGNAELMDYPT